MVVGLVMVVGICNLVMVVDNFQWWWWVFSGGCFGCGYWWWWVFNGVSIDSSGCLMVVD